jgi:hypothetical protein
VLALAAALALVVAAAGLARPSVFPCHSTWTLDEGKPAGQVVAHVGVNCAGLARAGSLTVTGRLLKLDARTGKWQLEQRRTGHWSTLTATHTVALHEPCARAFFRALFSAVLRSPGGAVAGRLTIDSGRLKVVVPCSFG